MCHQSCVTFDPRAESQAGDGSGVVFNMVIKSVTAQIHEMSMIH